MKLRIREAVICQPPPTTLPTLLFFSPVLIDMVLNRHCAPGHPYPVIVIAHVSCAHTSAIDERTYIDSFYLFFFFFTDLSSNKRYLSSCCFFLPFLFFVLNNSQFHKFLLTHVLCIHALSLHRSTIPPAPIPHSSPSLPVFDPISITPIVSCKMCSC